MLGACTYLTSGTVAHGLTTAHDEETVLDIPRPLDFQSDMTGALDGPPVH